MVIRTLHCAGTIWYRDMSNDAGAFADDEKCFVFGDVEKVEFTMSETSRIMTGCRISKIR